VTIWAGLVLAATLLLLLPALPLHAQDAEDKPRLVFLKLGPWKPVPGDQEELPQAYLAAEKFEVADRVLTQRVMEEWEYSFFLPRNDRGSRVRSLHAVQVVAAGKFMAYTENGWLVSFHVVDAQSGAVEDVQGGGEEKFYSLLDDADPVGAPKLVALAKLFGIPPNPNPRPIREPPPPPPPEAEKPERRPEWSSTGTSIVRESGPEPTQRAESYTLAGDDIKALLIGNIVAFPGGYFIRYEDDGEWSTSREADGSYDDKGDWSIQGDELCATVEDVDEPVCRRIRKSKEGKYIFILRSGSEQEFRIIYPE
jgi:hypothetical protein